jgi:hypothetical protein
MILTSNYSCTLTKKKICSLMEILVMKRPHYLLQISLHTAASENRSNGNMWIRELLFIHFISIVVNIYKLQCTKATFYCELTCREFKVLLQQFTLTCCTLNIAQIMHMGKW